MLERKIDVAVAGKLLPGAFGAQIEKTGPNAGLVEHVAGKLLQPAVEPHRRPMPGDDVQVRRPLIDRLKQRRAQCFRFRSIAFEGVGVHGLSFSTKKRVTPRGAPKPAYDLEQPRRRAIIMDVPLLCPL